MGFLGRHGAERRALNEEDDPRTGFEIGSASTGVGMIGVGLSYTSSTISPLPLTLMTQEMDPTVKDWLDLGENGELGRRTIWFSMEIARTPLLAPPTIDGISSVVHRGVYPRW